MPVLRKNTRISLAGFILNRGLDATPTSKILLIPIILFILAAMVVSIWVIKEKKLKINVTAETEAALLDCGGQKPQIFINTLKVVLC